MKNKQSQKNTHSDWQEVELSDVSVINMGQSPLSSAYNEIKQGLPLIQGNNDIKNKKTVGNIWTTEITKIAEKGQLILTVRAPVGAVGIAHDKVCIGRGVCAIESEYKPFLWHFLNYFEPKWNTLEQGSTFTAVNSSDIKKIKLRLPLLPEQNRIVSVLETWDKSIEKLTHKIETKKQIKKALMQDLLTGNKRLSGFNENWKSVKLGDITTFKKGKGLPKSEIDSNGKYEAIHYGELFTKYAEYIETVISKTNSNKNMFLSKRNDILMPTSDVTPRGLSTASYLDKDGVVLGGDILVIRSLGDLNGLFFCYIVNMNKKEVIKLVSGSTVFHLYGSDMAKFNLKLPPLKEQESIVKILVMADREIKELEKKLTFFKEQKRYLLNNLITGKIRTPETLSTKS
ncbi:MAG: restriction endonuclease subunit S [Candidatus Paceibacterota bacterium]